MKGFAERAVECFDKAKHGSSTQARILESIMDGFKILSDRGKLEVTEDDASAMSDEDLERYIERKVQGVVEEKADG